MAQFRVAGAPLDFAALRDELAVPGEFSAELLRAADTAVAEVELPDEDATDIPLITIDPPGSRDLDQAVHIEANDAGYLVSYAIADVAAFVRAGSLLDEEAHRRGATLYFPDTRVPMLPPAISESGASLLAGQLRPALLWRMQLDAAASLQQVDVRRARVRSRSQLDYPGVQRSVDEHAAGIAELLAEVGTRRLALARARHAINLDLPEQTVTADEGNWRLAARAPLPVEQFNAEISLLTGMAAAQLMLQHDYGILRTVPPPDERALIELRRAAQALGVDWPASEAPGDVLAGLDRTNPRHVVLIEHAASLLRGAAYTTFDGATPPQALHAGIGASYTHVTAPLRRLVDRYAGEICLAHHAGTAIPRWVRDGLDALPAEMSSADRRAHEVDRAVVDATEAWLLRDRIGEEFSALVLDTGERAGTIALDDPTVRARCQAVDLLVGERITVRLTEADVTKRSVRFARAD